MDNRIVTDLDIRVPGHRLLPYEVRHIRKRIAKAPNLDAVGGTSDVGLLRLAAAANIFMLRNVALAVMLIAFTMAAITRAHGGPLHRDGTPISAGSWAFIVGWWSLVALGLLFLGMAVARGIQAGGAARRHRDAG